MLTKKVFLASSSELKEDRKEFELFIGRKNKEWKGRGITLELVIWEDFLDAVSKTRSQDEYNAAIRQCDIFVMLFHTKVGMYTEEEFDIAFAQFRASNKPVIFTYFKDVQVGTASANQEDLFSLWAFQKKLKALEHFYSVYQNADGLKLHFNQQLEKVAASRFIESDQNKGQAAAPGGMNYLANLAGSGAIAQGGGTAVGGGAVYVGGQNLGNINLGTQITTGDVSGTGIAIGPAAHASVSQVLSPRDLEPLFAPVLAAIVQQAPPDKQIASMEQVSELKAEVAKGPKAEDGKIAGIVHGLAAQVPGAIGAVVSMFATPLLCGITGPVTKMVLDKLRLD